MHPMTQLTEIIESTNFLQEFFMEVIDINNVNDFLPIKN